MPAPREAQPATATPTLGRPHGIDAVIDHHANGDPVTAADRIISIVRAGGYIEHAAAAAGVQKVTCYEWVRAGARASKAREKGKTLDPLDEQLAAFSNAVSRAEGEWVAEAGARLAAAARGGRVTTTTTTKRDAAGNVVETTERQEIVPPNPAVDQWRLERRMPQLYGRRVVEVSGPDGGPVPVEVRARELAESLRAARAASTAPNVGKVTPKRTRSSSRSANGKGKEA